MDAPAWRSCERNAVIGANGFLLQTASLVADCAPCKGEAMVHCQHRSIDDLRFSNSIPHGIFDTASAEVMAGCDDVTSLRVDTRAWLRDPSLAVAPMWQACATSSMWPQRPGLQVLASAVMRRWSAWDTYNRKKNG